jgi:hypothetical protein
LNRFRSLLAALDEWTFSQWMVNQKDMTTVALGERAGES